MDAHTTETHSASESHLLPTLIRARAEADQRSQSAIQEAARDMRLAAELTDRIETIKGQQVAA